LTGSVGPFCAAEELTEVEGKLGFLVGSMAGAAAPAGLPAAGVVAVGNIFPGSGIFCSRRFASLRCLKDRTPAMICRPAANKIRFYIHKKGTVRIKKKKKVPLSLVPNKSFNEI
jgi:hypothetical protein